MNEVQWKDGEYRIAALVHSSLVARIVREETLQAGWDIPIRVTSYKNALSDARKFFAQGAEVILCHGGFREAIFKEFGRQIIFIERSDIDLIKALQLARQFSTTIALTAHTKEARDIEFMEKLLDISIIPIRYENSIELEMKISSNIHNGRTIFVGGGGTATFVHKYGGEIVLDEPHPVNIRNALNRAVVVAENIRMEERNLKNIQTMLQQFNEGVICTNADKEIIFYNPQALKLLNVPDPEHLARHYTTLHFNDVLNKGKCFSDFLIRISGKDLIINCFPVRLSGETNGAVCFIHDVKTIQKIHRKIEKNLHSRGLAATYTIDDICGESPDIVKLKQNIARFAPTDISVFINGETGSGKELAAHALHLGSKRKNCPFIAINCSALPDPLLESELFGYEEGAFTGAKRGGKPGLFELADKGTIFMDEIGDISPMLQTRLLRVLDTKEIMRVGGDCYIPVNVRILCASHKKLDEMVRKGSFRPDLFFRLSGVHIDVPALRDRKTDIPLLISGLLQKYGRDSQTLTQEIWKKILRYSWPGNVRELLSVIESYLILLGDQEGSLEVFEEVFRNRDSREAPEAQMLADRVKRFRREIAERELLRQNGNQEAVCKNLGISKSSLRRILEK